jgi:glucose/arabinose dehydrogenase/PKD repeat protein
MMMKYLLLLSGLFISILTFGGNGNNYKATRAQTAPVIDGNGSDACWNSATWYDVNYLWLGVQPSSADFTGKFKVTWDANKLYVIAEITDDVLNDNYPNPTTSYWEDDTWEIFLDENHSGGGHENTYNAFAYHISSIYDIVDSDLGTARLFNNHATVTRTKTGNVYTWEAAFDVYTSAYVYANGTSNPKATLTLGKMMGFSMAYCDNDGGTTRQSFIGSENVPGTNKNVAYINADVFGNLELVDVLTPSFSQVMVNNTDLTNPTVMTMLPDGRILIGQQAGTVKVVKNGAVLPGNALSITVDASGGAYTERGLIGITSDPNFATNGFIYIFFTTTVGGTHNRVSRFKMTGDVIDPASATIIVDLDPLTTASNHNGGALHFGVDGKLYIATGENATPANAQNLNNTHGKLLRLNPDGSIPTDNPYAADVNLSKRKIWQYGLRNPFTFDIQPGTGKIFINDVGQDAWEEINDGTIANKNFGWPNVEGAVTTTPNPYANPAFAYNHGTGNVNGCAITGGCFFNPTSSNYPSKYIGKYFFMDYCGNWMDVMDPATGLKTERFIPSLAGSAPVAVDVAADGNLYYLTRSPAALYKIAYSGSSLPDILQGPSSQSVASSQSATFNVTVTGVQPFTYRWQKNGVDVSAATNAEYKIPAVALGDAGNYRVIISNTFGSDTSAAAVLTVTPFNSKPTVTFSTAPANNALFTGGQLFNFVATATDMQDGLLPASAFTWHFDLHHNIHTHDGLPSTGSKNFNVTIPAVGHTDIDIYYKVYVVVKDAGGLTDTAFVNLLPTLKNITLKTVPAGLTLKLDDEPVVTPNTQQSIVGIERTINIVSPQTYLGKAYSFTGWSHGGSDNQTYTTANKDTIFTALFQETQVTKDSISPIHDAFTQYTSYDGTHANTTYGTTTPSELVVKNFSATPNRQTYIMFNLNNLIGNSADISSVKLKLYGSLTSVETGVNSIKVIAYEGTSNLWTENAVTWNNKPEKSIAKYDSVTVTNVSPTDQYFYLDLTALIQAKIAAGENLVTIVLTTPNDNAKRVVFQSKENIGGNGPKLVASYVANCASVITSPGTTYCSGSSLTLSANNGTGFTYKWYRNAATIPGATADTYAATTNGSYTVQITNATGCIKVSNVILVTQAALPTANILAPATSFCEGGSVTLSANTGTGLVYQWSNAAGIITTATNATYVANATGTYSVKVTNASNCSATSAPTSVTSNPLPTATVTSPANSFCTGGSVILSANTGTGLAYQWSNAAGVIASATNAAYTVTAADTYTVKVTNTNNCSATSTGTIITVNALPTATITSTSTSFCTGGSVILSANTGTGLTYQWSNAAGVIASATNATYTVTAADTYTVKVTNTNNCSATSTGTIVTVNALPAATITSTSTSFCTGGSVILSANTGTGLTYQWSNAAGIIASATNAAYTVSAAGTYTVKVTNTNNCSATSAGTTITVNTLPTATITSSATSFCTGGSVILSANTGAGLTYQWSNAAGIISSATNATYTATAAGTYTVEITNTNNCTATSAGTIVTVNALPAATITSTSTSFCTGGSVILSANTGTGLTYQWSNAAGIIASATNAAYTVSAAGTYTVKVTNTNNCSETSAGTTITVNILPTATITSSATSFCTGGSVILSANTGAGLTYQWSNAAGIISSATNATYTATAAGTYTVEITNTNNCTATSAGTTITVNALPTATITAPVTSFCTGASLILSANTGTGLTYQWSNAAGIIASATNAAYTVSTAGTYTVKVTNANNCSATSAGTTITENALPTATITAPATSFCTGGSVLLSANTSTGFIYEWSDAAGIIASATNSTYSVNAAGTYTVKVTNANNCSETSAGTTITVNALPTATITAPVTSFCTGTSLILSANTGTELTYQWSNAAGTIPSATNAAYTATTGDSYTVAVSNANSCTNVSSQLILTENSLPTAEITVTSTTFCSGNSVELVSTAGKSYQWFNGSGLIAGETNSTYSSTIAGVFSVEVTSNDNCVNTSEDVTLSVVTSVTWYADTDADGTGEAHITISSCTKPNGYVSVAGDQCPTDANKTEPGVCGCGETEASCVSTGINNNTGRKAFVLFPNPLTQTNLYFSDKISGSVYDAKGSIVLSFTEAMSIETSALENGLYLIQTETGDSYKFYIVR